MEERWTIEGTEVIVVHRTRIAAPCKMIDNDINHQVHSTSMNCCGKSFEVTCGSKVLIERVKILLPIAMICFTISCILGYNHVSMALARGTSRPTQLLGDWRDPNLLNVSVKY